jgi:hypothetical protein
VTEFDKVIPPGGVGKVTASLDTSRYKGPITKSVQVMTGDPGARPVVLLLKAEIVTVIDVAPSDTPVLRTTVGEPKPADLTLSASDGQAFDILAVQADPSVRVTVRPDSRPLGAHHPLPRLHPRSVAAGSSRYLLTITPTDKAPVGASIAKVTLRTNQPKAETVTIRAVLSVTGRVQVMPPQLVVHPGSEPPVLHVKIAKAGGGTLRILGVASSDPEFEATTTAIAKGREYDLAVRYTGKPGRGPLNSRITVTTDEPQQRTIVIPLTGRL